MTNALKNTTTGSS